MAFMSLCAEAGEMRCVRNSSAGRKRAFALGPQAEAQCRVFKMLLPGSASIFHFKTMNIVIPNLL